ncbi:hypothetical protein CcCBS67573_g06657 [Chytriomyces confervae]|uniref:RRM domain-containing protein n=1 Tax=Chytriomyces confervae TaxID=246404 RepID=A0A507F319_9FUNG|nr:hypothetical protein CcCBS67573_g06657 [Chytriomyces confervae]
MNERATKSAYTQHTYLVSPTTRLDLRCCACEYCEFNDVTETQLIEIFKEVGPVVQFRLVFDKDTGKPKGFGFCTFQDAEIAASAVRNLNNFEIGGRPIRIDFAEADTKDEPNFSHSSSRYDEKPKIAAAQPVIATGSSVDAISKALETIPSTQLLEVMAQLKLMAQTAPDQARALLSTNPQLAYAIFQAMLAMGVIDANVLQRVVQPQSHQSTGVLGSGIPAMNTPSFQAPVQPVVPAYVDPAQEQQKLLMQVLSLTPEQIQALPLDQRTGVLQLRAQLGVN